MRHKKGASYYCPRRALLAMQHIPIGSLFPDLGLMDWLLSYVLGSRETSVSRIQASPSQS